MNGYPQIIPIPGYMRKFLLLIPIFFILLFAILWGINHTGINLSSLPSIITAWVTINPLEVDVLAPSEVEINKVFKVEAKVINKGGERIENAQGGIFLQDGLILLKKDAVRKIGVIPGKKEKRVSWSVKGEEIGSYIITVSVSGNLRGDDISAQDSTKVEVKESLRGLRLPKWLQNLFDFFRGWFTR